MNKKKVLFTSLAALTLASLQAQTFAEEVDAGVTDGLVVETYVSDPEVDAPTMAEPVSATTESTGFLGLPASTINEISRQLSGVSETAVAEPVSETTESAGFLGLPASTINEISRQLSGVSGTATAEPVIEANQVAPAMDVQAIANGDYSSVEGEWVNEKGETLEITQAGPVISADQISFVSHYELTGQTGSTLKNISGSSYTEAYDAVLSGEVQGIYAKTVHINYIPQGSSFGWWSGRSLNLETVTATEDWIVTMPSSENAVPDLSQILEYRIYKRVAQPALPTTSEVVAQPAAPTVSKPTSTPVNEKPVSTPTAPVTEKEIAVSPFADYVGTWQAPAGDRLTISDKGILTFAGKDYPLTLRDGKLTAGEITGRFGFAYDAVKDAIYLGINGLGFNPAGLSAEKLAEARKWREDREYFYRVAKPEAGQVTTATPLQPSAQQELAQAQVSAPVHVPLTVKSDATAVAPVQTPAAVKSDNQAPTPTYSRVEAAKQAEATQTGLPNTGDVTSLLGVIGASLSALGLAGIKRRKG